MPFPIRGEVLLCKNCGSDYLHHHRIELFDREKEDSKEGLHVILEEGDVLIDRNLQHNPSSRRNGLSINFSCENCQATSVLNIVQDRGQTFLSFES